MLYENFYDMVFTIRLVKPGQEFAFNIRLQDCNKYVYLVNMGKLVWQIR